MMPHRSRFVAWAVASALTVVLTGLVLADGPKGVAVLPLTPKPGDVITVKGDGLGPGREVEVRVVGKGGDVHLGEVRADNEGDFTAQFRLPTVLMPGTYQVSATGAASATTEIRVLAAGGREGEVGSGAVMPVRERPLGESIGLVALFGVLAGLGLFLARSTRERTAR